MATRYDRAADGTLWATWNDDTREYTDFRADPAVTRAYSREENAEADYHTAHADVDAVMATLTEQIAAQIDTLLGSLTDVKTARGMTGDPAGTTTTRAIKNANNSTINAGPAPYVKGLVDIVLSTQQALVETQRSLIRVSRIVARVLDSANSGTS